MAKPTTVESEVARFRRDIDQVLRERIRETIQVVLEEELSDALGCHRHDRTSTRVGYRNGSIEREITTETGNQRLRIPRGRLDRNDGTTEEFRSEILPRYARRTRRVDDAILGVYLAGGNTRRIRKAMAPLLGEENLSKSAISRVVSRLKALFAEWNSRPVERVVRSRDARRLPSQGPPGTSCRVRTCPRCAWNRGRWRETADRSPTRHE